MAAGWKVRVTTLNSAGKLAVAKHFLSYESDKDRAVELVRKRVPVNEGERAEPVAEVAESEFIGEGMTPGDVWRHG